MYRNKVSGCLVCETAEDMLKCGIEQAYEDAENYYILCKKEDFYDNGMYKVNKKSGEISLIMFTVFITQIKNRTCQISTQKFIREMKKHS